MDFFLRVDINLAAMILLGAAYFMARPERPAGKYREILLAVPIAINAVLAVLSPIFNIVFTSIRIMCTIGEIFSSSLRSSPIFISFTESGRSWQGAGA